MAFIFKKQAPLITALFTFIIYITTMSRGVMPIDAGELAASQYSLGISHPSGYPLFNIIGYLWSKVPIGSVIFRLNLLSAIWVALANFFIIKIIFMVLVNTATTQIQTKKHTNKKAIIQHAPLTPLALLQMLAAMASVLVLSFCQTWWIQSAGVEVYSLHIALLSVFFFVFIKTFYKKDPSVKNWLQVGLCLGLCFTNHLTSILILPGVLFLFFIKMKFNIKALKMGLIIACSFTFIFLLFYGFMMVRAISSPITNFGNPNNIEYLKRHITGWQFQSFMGESDKKGDSIVLVFFKNFAAETAVIGLLLFIGGFIYGLQKNTKITVFWLLHFISTLIYASFYNIHDIENYFLLCYMAAAIFMAFGIYLVFEWIKISQKNKFYAFGLLLISIFPLVINYSSANQSKLHYIDEYTIAALSSVEKNAIIVSREWDVFVSPAYYYQLVEKQRPDVLILDKELLRRSWYFNQIKTWDKTFASKIEKQANEFNKAVLPFERKQKFNAKDIQVKYEAYLTAILSEYKTRPVYVSSFVLDADIANKGDVKLPAGTLLIPESYFFRVVNAGDSIYYPLPVPLQYNVSFTNDKKDNKFESQILHYSMNVLSSRVGYEMGFGKNKEARKIVEIMQTIDPSIKMPEGL